MKKIKVLFFLILILFLATGCGKNEKGGLSDNKNISDSQSQQLFQDTLSISQEYALLHWETENVLRYAEEYPSYEDWKREVDVVLEKWSKLEEKAGSLEATADEYAGLKTGFSFLNTARAITNREITDVFDKAPAGKKIRTLAKFLGVDAKRAFAILQQSQNQAQADAWNEAGDSFENLENAAIVIKDGCKVAGFVGGVAISGGTAGLAAASTATKAVVVVSGADLALEVTEDTAKIALGNDNDISKFVGDARKITEPAASILAIGSIPGNLETGFDKFSAVMIALDQFRSGIQENKVIGIALPDSNDGGIKGASMTEEEIEEWLNSMGISDSDKDFDDLMKMIQEKLESESGSLEEGTEEENAEEPEEEEPDGGEEAVEEEEESEEAENSTLSPDVGYGKDGKVKAVFSSPLEKEFMPGQARLWKVEVSDFDHQMGTAYYYCDFIFYLNGVKYREMLDNRGCGFTGTFIDKEGSLRAEAKVNFVKSKAIYDDSRNFMGTEKEVFDSITLSHEYEVATPVAE
jgi:hypothetical protein